MSSTKYKKQIPLSLYSSTVQHVFSTTVCSTRTLDANARVSRAQTCLVREGAGIANRTIELWYTLGQSTKFHNNDDTSLWNGTTRTVCVCGGSHRSPIVIASQMGESYPSVFCLYPYRIGNQPMDWRVRSMRACDNGWFLQGSSSFMGCADHSSFVGADSHPAVVQKHRSHFVVVTLLLILITELFWGLTRSSCSRPPSNSTANLFGPLPLVSTYVFTREISLTVTYRNCIYFFVTMISYLYHLIASYNIPVYIHT